MSFGAPDPLRLAQGRLSASVGMTMVPRWATGRQPLRRLTPAREGRVVWTAGAEGLGLHGPGEALSLSRIVDDLRNDQYTGHVTRQMTVTEVKAKLLALLDEVERGEEIEITRHGLTVARLTALKGPHALEGRFAGVAMSAASDDDLFTTGAPWQLS